LCSKFETEGVKKNPPVRLKTTHDHKTDIFYEENFAGPAGILRGKAQQERNGRKRAAGPGGPGPGRRQGYLHQRAAKNKVGKLAGEMKNRKSKPNKSLGHKTFFEQQIGEDGGGRGRKGPAAAKKKVGTEQRGDKKKRLKKKGSFKEERDRPEGPGARPAKNRKTNGRSSNGPQKTIYKSQNGYISHQVLIEIRWYPKNEGTISKSKTGKTLLKSQKLKTERAV